MFSPSVCPTSKGEAADSSTMMDDERGLLKDGGGVKKRDSCKSHVLSTCLSLASFFGNTSIGGIQRLWLTVYCSHYIPSFISSPRKAWFLFFPLCNSTSSILQCVLANGRRQQCLEYANGNIAQALKVCTTFCNFRISEGWDLVLSPEDLEGPLRSRVHTLTEERDR